MVANAKHNFARDIIKLTLHFLFSALHTSQINFVNQETFEKRAREDRDDLRGTLINFN